MNNCYFSYKPTSPPRHCWHHEQGPRQRILLDLLFIEILSRGGEVQISHVLTAKGHRGHLEPKRLRWESCKTYGANGKHEERANQKESGSGNRRHRHRQKQDRSFFNPKKPSPGFWERTSKKTKNLSTSSAFRKAPVFQPRPVRALPLRVGQSWDRSDRKSHHRYVPPKAGPGEGTGSWVPNKGLQG